MAEEKRMNFYRTFYDLTTLLPEAERRKVNTALLDYFFEGIEPSGLSESGLKVFKGCEGRISKSRTNASNVASRYSDSKATKAPTKQGTKPLPEGERERDRDREKVSANADTENPRAKFEPPTAEEVMEYAAKMGYEYYRDRTKAEHFIAYYGERDWLKSNGKPVGNWKNTLRNWNANDVSKYGEKAPSVRVEASDYAIYD